MAQHSGISGDALESARAAVAARDRELADADRELADAVAAAHAIAVEATGQLDAIAAQIEAAVARQSVDTPVVAHEFARFLVAKQREMVAIISRARADVDAKTAALQQLTDRFRFPVQR